MTVSLHLTLVLKIYTLSCRSFPTKNFLIQSQGEGEKPGKKLNKDECVGGDLPTGLLSQELNHYGSVCVLWIVHRKYKNEVFYVIKNSILLIAIARMGHTVLWVWARSWAVKFFVEGDKVYLSSFGRRKLRSRVLTELKGERNKTWDYLKTCRKNATPKTLYEKKR